MSTPDTLASVRAFMAAMGQDLDRPMDRRLLRFRLTLLGEEYREVQDAANDLIAYTLDGFGDPTDLKANLLKELCDLQYVLDGFFAAFGLDKATAFDRVHQSNMSKLVDGAPLRRADGKVMKGPNYQPADLRDIV